MQKQIAAYTIRHNQTVGMEVSNLVIGYSRVEKFFKKYYSTPESERTLGNYDIFGFQSIDEAMKCHIDSVVSELSRNGNLLSELPESE